MAQRRFVRLSFTSIVVLLVATASACSNGGSGNSAGAGSGGTQNDASADAAGAGTGGSDAGTSTGGQGGSSNASQSYVGTWTRSQLLVDGSPMTFCNAALQLTTTTWRSYTTGGGAQACDCDMTGTLSVAGTTMTWTITSANGQYCGVVGPGDTFTFSWSVDNGGTRLTLTTGTQVEVYTKEGNGAGGASGSGGTDGGSGGPMACDQIDGFSLCTEYAGSATPQMVAQLCSASGGTLVSACPTANSLGACLQSSGQSNEATSYLYSTGGTPFTAQTAEQTCGNLGGTWSP